MAINPNALLMITNKNPNMKMRLTPKVMPPSLTRGQETFISTLSAGGAGRSRAGQLARVLGLAGALAVLAALPASSATVVWNHTTGDRNWSTAGNWTGGTPSSTNDVIFNNTDAQTANTPVNTVDASTTVKSLSYTNSYTNTAAYLSFQSTTIGSSQTLTVTNGLNVGVGDATGYSGEPYTYATITGAGGTLSVTGGNVAVGNDTLSTSGGKNLHVVLDMRGLDNFNYNSSSGSFMVAAATHPRQGGAVYLAGTNLITASAISLGIVQQNLSSLGGTLHLGQTNNLFADTFMIGKFQRSNLVDFASGLTSPAVKIRARDGLNGVGNMYLGWNPNTTTASSYANGTNDFSAGVVDAVITNLYLGWYTGISSPSYTGRTADGTFIVGTNSRSSLVVQNLYIASINNTAAVDTPSSTGLLDARGGTITAGTVTLAQQVVSTSTVRGTLKLTGGTMTVSGNIVAGGGTSSIIVSNATLSVAGMMGSSSQYLSGLSLSNNAALALKLLGGSNPTVFATNFTVGSASTISLSADTWSAGQFPLIAYSSVGGLGVAALTLVTPPGVIAGLVDNTANHTVDVLITDTPGIKWTGALSSDWNIAGTYNWTKNGISTNYNEMAGVGPQVFFDDTAANTAVNLTTTVSPDGIVAQNGTKTYTFSGSGKLSGAGGMSKQGAGTLILANTTPNDYAGLTAVSAGTVQIGNGGTAGSLGMGGILNSATLVFNRSDALLVSGPVSGSGTLRQQGAGVVSIPNVTSYSGPVIINVGVLAMGASATLTPSGLISGNGSFGVVGSGTVVLTNNNNYSGGTVIYSGTLQIGDGTGNGVLPAGSVVDNGALVLNYPTPFTLANSLSGTGSVASINGDLTLSGVNTYSGLTIRTSGSLIAGSATGLSSASTVIIGATNGTGVGTLDLGSYSPIIGGLVVGGNSLFSMSGITFGGSRQTLTINGNVAIGNTNSSSTGGLGISSDGTCSLVISNDGGSIQLGLLGGAGTTGQGTQPNNLTVDLSSLASLRVNLGASGNLWVGDLNGNIRGASAGVTPYDILTLAVSNVLSIGTISVGAGGTAFTPELHLGSGTNILNADAIKVGTGTRDSGTFIFGGSSGSVAVRGYAGGVSRAALSIGTGTQATASAANNTVDFTGHYADLLLSTVDIGDQANRVGSWSQTFSFDQGILDISSVDLGNACLSGTAGTSTMNLHGGTAAIGSFTFMRANTASTAAATLDIAGGAVVRVAGDILKGSAVGTASLNVSSATLIARGLIGNGANPIDSLTLSSATLNLDIAGTSNPASAPVQAASFQPSSVTLTVSGPALTVGQFPLISYGTLGGAGFSGLTLANPSGVGAYLSNNLANSSIDLVVTNLPSNFVTATNVNVVRFGPTTFEITGDGGANQAYYVWAYTNVAAPVSSWWRIGLTNADGAGAIHFMDTQATNAQRFYRFGQ